MPEDPSDFLHERMAFTRESRGRLKVSSPEACHMRRVAEDFLGMIDAYISDAGHFESMGDISRAIEAVSYAYGWMDAGVRIGLFDVAGDGDRFTLAE
ncbi:MAG: DUF357 domain-containing protein [Thermoplasmata archaeon]|nr:DUF357 domain-containing protein [Thermoplasmata archaeon]